MLFTTISLVYLGLGLLAEPRADPKVPREVWFIGRVVAMGVEYVLSLPV